MLAGVFALVVAVGGLFWLAYRRPRPRRWLIPRRPQLAARKVADRSGTALPPTKVADHVAELNRPLGPNPDEQAGRRAEVAAALRRGGREDALPAVIRCADAAFGVPHGLLLAAEAVGFPNFAVMMASPARADRQAAFRALSRTTRGGRDGALDVSSLIRTGLLEHLADVTPGDTDPWQAAALIEAERVSRRVESWLKFLPATVRESVNRGVARLTLGTDRRQEALRNLAARLIARFPAAPTDEQAASLCVLDDLHADVSELFPTLPDRGTLWWADAVRGLRWARARDFGPALAEQAERLLSTTQPGAAADAVLTGLRGSRTPAVERVILAGAAHTDAATRRAAIASFGWVEPFDRVEVIGVLHSARCDSDKGVRRAAVGALARFGELAALREFAQGLLAEEPAIRLATALAAANEGVSWLWPDLDLVADHADPDTAIAAAEALERMREAALGIAD